MYIYKVMKWAGQYLATYMRNREIPFLTEQELRVPASQIIVALQMIHKAGFLHNHVKPNNILITHKQLPHRIKIKVKLCGFSKCFPTDLGPYLQNPPITLYSAPEVIMEGNYSVASDIWAFGVTLFTLANGRLPFKNMNEIMTKELDWGNR